MTNVELMEQTLANQRAAYMQKPMPTAEERIAKLKSLRESLKKYQDEVVNALSADFGHRSSYDTILADILPVLNNLKYCIHNVKRWMKPKGRKAGMLLMPARVKVMYQPLGVVGVMVPWNFPVMLSVGPLAFILAAGNRAMIKMSEFTPNINQVVSKIISETFPPEEVAVFEGAVEESQAFSRLRFDHLLFTGSTAVGRQIMAAAAENLVPVTLELGGKSPVIIDDKIPLDMAVERMILGKCLNAGQICIAPDYVLLPRERVDGFIQAYKDTFSKKYTKNGNGREDYTCVINQHHFDRLNGLIEDAKAKGATIINPDQGNKINDPARQRMATQIVVGATRDMRLMNEEIFGPVLPLVPYDSLQEAIDYVNSGERPLALYIMSLDSAIQGQILANTHSGGACINDTILHCTADDAPFGGVGASGMGAYHGKEGFETFSHTRTVLSRGARLNTGKMVHPPYGGLAMRMMLKVFMR